MKKSTRIISVLLILFGSFLFLLSKEIERSYGNTGFDRLLFTMFSPAKGANLEPMWDIALHCILPALAAAALTGLIARFEAAKKLLLPISLAAFVALSVLAVFSFGIVDYFKNQSMQSDLVALEYVDPRTAQLTFPENKKNLIYIYLESMESTYSEPRYSEGTGDILIQNLTNLAKKNTNFSHTGGVGGAVSLTGTGWTSAALAAHSSGLPLLVSMDTNLLEGFRDFLPGAWTLGDILDAQGYRQMFLIGSDADYGSRDQYFAQHGGAEIKDYTTAVEDGIIDEGYFVWWGFEDERLYAYAKQQLPLLAAGDAPFCLTMLTVDTHFEDGYLCPLCEDIYGLQFNNVLSCADRQILAFVEWLKTQDFYEDTVIVITGDHISMDNAYFEKAGIIDDDHHLYNVFLNAAVTPKNAKNRIFSAVDMFPTTLAAMGVKIKGNRLGLGVNLFSGEKTLPEIYGLDRVNEELTHYSAFYHEKLLNVE